MQLVGQMEMMYTYSATGLIFLLTAWTLAAGSVFDNTKACESDITAKSITFTSGIKTEISNLLPWFIHYSTYDGFTERSKIEFLEESIHITPPTVKHGKPVEPQTISVKWEDLLIGANSFDLELNIWKFDATAGVLGYYLCKTKGGKEGGKPHIGVAFTTSRGGGVAEETLDTAKVFKEYAEQAFGISSGSFRKYDL